ncbi:uncharacterized protein FA14DRAFT_172963 [Meira miltonrushii]|uniref:RRM domain-containing protein n=1 Tax=Meira miltonrushii TaxID=1280837 RepID=A0A316VFW1_9BASI|nr:uncharacterized protein FA14DRAFT_172963 [Meira miltonrushii]PWN36420.1 hypothetical protein FA14DRAFT_172963 [Meira miltonrushii]
MNDGEEIEAVNDVETTKSDSSPKSYFRWLQSLRTKLLHGEKSRLPELREALDQKYSVCLLTFDQALLRGALALQSIATRNDASQSSISLPLSDASALSEVFSIHRAHTFDSAGSSLDARIYLAYVSLILHLHYVYMETQPADVELSSNELESSSSKATLDLVHDWTNDEAGPKFYQDGRYASLGAAKAPTQAQAKAAGIDAEWDAILSVDAVRFQLHEAVTRIAADQAQSQKVWSLYYQFELTHQSQPPSERDTERIKSILLSRLRTPHTQYEATAQALSSFVTQRLPPAEYESIMSAAYDMVGRAKQIIEVTNRWEETVASIPASSRISQRWLAWKPYTSWASGLIVGGAKKGSKTIDTDSVIAIFERALLYCGLPPSCAEELMSWGGLPISREEIASMREKESKQQRTERRAKEEEELKADLQACAEVWSNYLHFLRSAKASASICDDVCARATKALPANGALQGQILRTYCRTGKSAEQIDATFATMMCNEELQSNAESLTELFLARIDIERDRAAQKLVSNGEAKDVQSAFELLIYSSDAFMSVFAVMSFALESIAQVKPADEQLQLHQVVSQWCLGGGQETAALMEPFWDAAMKAQPTNHTAILFSSKYYQMRTMYGQSKHLLKQGLSRRDISSSKKLELAQELLQVSRLSGSLPDVDWAYHKVAQERERSWSEYYASSYAAMSATANEQTAVADTEMADEAVDTGSKRKAENHDQDQSREPMSPEDKRGKMGEVKNQRDREHSSVIVDNLPADASEKDIFDLFRDCGDILEITGPKVWQSSNAQEQTATALVEFVSRDAIPAVQSRQGKPIRSLQVNIHLGYKCTLYVTNFPPTYDSDESMRELFGEFGRIFDVRWPSKKFNATRRFCYVVFCSPTEAHAAQKQLHNRSFAEDKTVMQVMMSDPNRKKVRSDAFKDDCELFVSGLPKHVEEADLKELFGQSVAQVRILKHPDGRNRGIAYVDMETALDAQQVLGKAAEMDGGGYRLQGKLLRVSKVDQKKMQGGNESNSLTSRMDIERRSRCLYIRGLPSHAQEAIIQQIVEKVLGHGSVKQIEWQAGQSQKATVEFIDAPTAGRAALIASSTLFYDEQHPIQLVPLESRGAAGRMTAGSSATISPSSSNTMMDEDTASTNNMVPRQAGNRSNRGGRGGRRGGHTFVRQTGSVPMDVEDTSKGKGQDAFRQMLGK